jgi:predicted metalloprotease
MRFRPNRLRCEQLIEEGTVFRIGKSKRRDPRHGKIVETAKRLIVEWSNELRAVVDRLMKLGPDIRHDLRAKSLAARVRGRKY